MPDRDVIEKIKFSKLQEIAETFFDIGCKKLLSSHTHHSISVRKEPKQLTYVEFIRRCGLKSSIQGVALNWHSVLKGNFLRKQSKITS